MDLKKGIYVTYEGEPWTVEELNNDKFMLKHIFSDKIIELPINKEIQEADIIRKCATIISKKKDKVEIIDIDNYNTFDAMISSELLKKANEGDNVTYVKHEDNAKVVELRK